MGKKEKRHVAGKKIMEVKRKKEKGNKGGEEGRSTVIKGCQRAHAKLYSTRAPSI
jgi:hypothetical protein